MRNKKFVKCSLSEVLPYNPRHIVCRQLHHHTTTTTALRLRSLLPRRFTSAAHRLVAAAQKSSLRMGRDPILTATVAQNHHSHIHTPKPLSSLAAQPNSNGYPTHKQSPQPPFTVKDKAAIMGTLFYSIARTVLIADTTLSLDLRNKLGLRGIMPPAVDTPDIQIERCLARIRAKPSNLDKYTLNCPPS